MLKRFTRRLRSSQRQPSGPPGARAYAIGDVHGRLDLLVALLETIEDDSLGREPARQYIVFLGDLIDRGPDSAGVIDLLLRVRDRLPQAVFLKGNHEEMALGVLKEDSATVWDWLRYGGYEFAQSYGVEVGGLPMLAATQAARTIANAVPLRHIQFMDGFADSFRFGDYLFVHAGIRPEIPLEKQVPADLRWIREEFLESTVRHPYMVVHGHSISDGPDERPNRIGIDTGAYQSGVLTAICIEGDERRFLTAEVT